MDQELLSKANIEVKRAEKEKLLAKLQDPAVIADYRQIAELNTELKDVDDLIETYDRYVSKSQQLAENQSLLDDLELGELAKAEIPAIEADVQKLETKLRDLTALKLEDDERIAIFEIRAGTGGAEAALFADEIQRMYIRYINTLGYQVEQVHTNFEETGGIKESIFRVIGKGAFGKLRFESGVHRVQRVPTTEANGRIHTSAISVVVLPELPPTEVNIPDSDIRVDVYRSSGAGGQGVNRTDSAVRLTHLPTGITVTCQDGRSQHKNKEKAFSILAAKLHQIELEKSQSQSKDMRSQSILSGDRSAKIRTYNFPQGRITDHRIQQSWFNISEVLEGEVGEIVDTVNTRLRQNIADGKSIAAEDDNDGE